MPTNSFRNSVTLFFVLQICNIFLFAQDSPVKNSKNYIIVLGITQDGGFPHAGCQKSCCAEAWKNPELRKNVACLGIVDQESNTGWMIDATPDFKFQLHTLQNLEQNIIKLGGILLTHGHIGHYTGLMHLGREVMGAKSVPVYAMPRMVKFLSGSGPWEQLIRLHNIDLVQIEENEPIPLSETISVTPILVPHRDEYTETAGYLIHGPDKSCLYISDIDKWDSWDQQIEELISQVDYTFLDATFYDQNEIPGRDMSEIPHPFIIESMSRFKKLTSEERSKIYFIHFNHTNPVLQKDNPVREKIRAAGFNIAVEGLKLEL
jgi:pyrroloquinoline quinone biosynthesis protein B